VHDIDVCLFEQELFIINLINNLGLKLVNSINRGLNFPTFSILKVGFEYKKWKQLFSIFVFYEYEYNDIFVYIVKTQNYIFEWCECV